VYFLQSVAVNSRLKWWHVLWALAYFSLAITTSKLLGEGHYIVDLRRPTLGLNWSKILWHPQHISKPFLTTFKVVFLRQQKIGSSHVKLVKPSDFHCRYLCEHMSQDIFDHFIFLIQ